MPTKAIRRVKKVVCCMLFSEDAASGTTPHINQLTTSQNPPDRPCSFKSCVDTVCAYYSTSGLNTVHSKDITFKQDCKGAPEEGNMNRPKMQVENHKTKDMVWRLFLVNTVSFGLEVCMAVVTVYIPPVLLQAGMEERYMTMVLAVAPVVGLICIPMIGSASDSWQSHFGRRRPFIWMLSLGVLLGLQVMPRAWSLAMLVSPQYPHSLVALLQAGAVCLIDFCVNACITVLAALLSDLFPGEEENRRAFSINSMMTSLGGCLGFLLPALDWSQTPIATYLGGQEAFIYTLLTFVLLSCLLPIVFIVEETGTRGGERKTVAPLKSLSSRSCCRPQCFIVTLGRCISACQSVLPHLYATCSRVPMVIWRLFVAEMCSWMALMSIMFFFADFMGEGLYQGVPIAEPQSHERKLYDEGVRIGSLGLFLQCMVSVLCSVMMDFWVALLGTRVVYVSSAVLLVFATAFMSISNNVLMVTVMAAMIGYTLSVLQIVPYTLLCLYHSDRQAFFTSPTSRRRQLSGKTRGLTLRGAEPHVSLFADEGAKSEVVSQRGMCFDVAILDSAYLLSQVVPAMCLGYLVQLANSVRAYMASACCFSLLAFFCSTKVVYSHADLQR